MRDLNVYVFERLLARGTHYHTNQIGGKLVSDAMDFSTSYMNLTNTFILNGSPFALTIIIGLIVVGLQSWQLGLFLFIVVAITITGAYSNAKVRSNLRTKRLTASKNVISHLSDSVVNAQTVKIFSAEEKEVQKNKYLNEELKKLRLHDWQTAGKSGNVRASFLMLMIIALILIIKHLSSGNTAVIGTSIFAFTYTFTLLIRLFDINSMTRIIEESYLNASPMTTMLSESIEVKDAPEATKLHATNGKIDFKNIVFQYADANKQNVFQQLTLNINSGEKVGLVGPSGGGKTTLTRLLLRFEDIQSGEICIDDQNIALVTQNSLRQAVAYVPQEPLLFHRSIAENISYGAATATQVDITTAAKLANADEFIRLLPNGYDTVVGERGIKLSGGQRQRVAIARAIIKNAPILLLDEATSALDSESESLIQESLQNLMQNKTALVIAHRLSTIQRMDRIIVLNDGKIVEEGSHKELLKNKRGLYSKLWAHQSGGFLKD